MASDVIEVGNLSQFNSFFSLSVAYYRPVCSPGGYASHGGVCVQAAASTVTEVIYIIC